MFEDVYFFFPFFLFCCCIFIYFYLLFRLPLTSSYFTSSSTCRSSFLAFHFKNDKFPYMVYILYVMYLSCIILHFCSFLFFLTCHSSTSPPFLLVLLITYRFYFVSLFFFCFSLKSLLFNS